MSWVKVLGFNSVLLNQVNGDVSDNVCKQHFELQFNTNKITAIKSDEGEVECLEQTFLLREQLCIHLKSI